VQQFGYIYKLWYQFRKNKIVYLVLWTVYEDGFM